MMNKKEIGMFFAEDEARKLLKENHAKVEHEFSANLKEWNAKFDVKVERVGKNIEYDNQVNWLYIPVKTIDDASYKWNRWYFYIDKNNHIWWDNKPIDQK